MAASFQQQARYRKLVYTALILALFTGALMHRKFVIETKASNLQLRETDRGEVELTGSAVRLVLTGSRGLAITILWNDVLKKQEKHKWNEVELLVNSITELQPYFMTPWLFQSWNLAFNVAVENDRPRDKYYYISRGLDHLARGERRNSVPGNPDLRHHMGVYYQLKLGISDEKMTMRSLLDLSAIDPVERDASLLGGSGGGGKDINEKEFNKFCKDYPRLVRRLRDQLGYNAADIISFLRDNRDVPSRFTDKVAFGRTKLKEPTEQWPILPPKTADRQGDWPDPAVHEPGLPFGLTRESFDIFMVTRTWHTFSQQTLPPPNRDPGVVEPRPPHPMRERLPRRPTLIIFRNFPARAQAYMAETLQEEGWFDDHGWFIKDWFTESTVENPEMGLLVGDQVKFHSGLAWAKAAHLYKTYGRENGLYLDPADRKKLMAQAKAYREQTDLKAEERPTAPPTRNAPQAVRDGFFAHEKLYWSQLYRGMTNFDAMMNESEAKSTPQAVAALKLFDMAEAWRKKAPPVTMLYYERNDKNQYEAKTAPLLSVYDRANELWLGVLLRSPAARKIMTLQEESYELELKFIRYFQDEKLEKTLRPLLKAVPLGLPGPGSIAVGHAQELYELGKGEWTRLRDFRGPFDMTYALDGLEDFDEHAVKTALLLWSTGGKPQLALHPDLAAYQLSTIRPRLAPPVPGWQPLISSSTISVVRNRYRGLQQLNEPPGQPRPTE